MGVEAIRASDTNNEDLSKKEYIFTKVILM